MGRRTPCCDNKKGLKKGPWTADEDDLLLSYISKHGHSCWRSIPQAAGLNRCGKSCRLRWTNYLRPDIKRGPFTPEEEKLVLQLHAVLGNRWAAIATNMPGRTDNEIKNLWNTHLRKRLISMGIDPQTHEPASANPPSSPSTRHMAQWESARLEAEARLSKECMLHNHNNISSCSSQSKYSESDYFLRIWNSEAGESFRNKSCCESPVSQASSCTTKCGSSSAPTPTLGDYECKASVKEDGVGRSDLSPSMGSHQREEDSTESAVHLLLDFPFGCNEMSFLEENIDGYFNLHLSTRN